MSKIKLEENQMIITTLSKSELQDLIAGTVMACLRRHEQTKRKDEPLNNLALLVAGNVIARKLSSNKKQDENG